MSTATTSPDVTPGARVQYRGSLTDHHGAATVLGRCDDSRCWDAEDVARLTGAPEPIRWEVLTDTGNVLSCVRTASLAPTTR